MDIKPDEESIGEGGMPAGPPILARVADLYFASRIESAAERAGLAVVWVDEGEEGGKAVPGAGGSRPASGVETVEGLPPGATPRLAIVDLNQAGAVDWIRQFKAGHPAGQLVAFGSHMDPETLKEARKAGADRALARSRFIEVLPGLMEIPPGGQTAG